MTTAASSASTTTERGQSGVSRVLSKLDNSIESGNYYEAHQMYRTLYFRYITQKKYAECADLLYNGSLKLLTKYQESSAADLALLLIDTLEKRGNKEDVDLWVTRLFNIISLVSVTTVERETLINRAITWSSDLTNNLGHPNLHKQLAQLFWDEDNIEQSRHHYLLCRDGNVLGYILIKIHQSKGYASEIDMFITQAILQQLCLKERKTAEETFTTYTVNHPQIKREKPPFDKPLLNFTYYLFRCIDESRGDTFRMLKEMYKPFINRDPAYEKYLIKIGVIYFGETAPPSTGGGGGIMGGMFGDLFASLFQGFDDGVIEEQSSGQTNGRIDTQANELD